MRAAVLHTYGEALEFVDRPVPEPSRHDDVVVRVGGAGVCATDLHAIDGQMEVAGVTIPRVLGHENAGWVHAVGDGVATVAAGDAVIVFPPHSCGLCLACRRGIDMFCERHQFTGLTVDGGFADYVLVPERSLIKLPAGVEPADVAPHADAGLTAYHAIRRVAHLAVPGATAVVVGVGGVGHIALQLLGVLGAARVVAVDPVADRRALAAELGADAVLGESASPVDAVRELTDGRGADIVLDFVGSDATHLDSMAMLRRGGTYSIVGFGGTLAVPSPELIGNEHTIVGNLVGTWPDLFEMLQLHASGRIRLHSQTYPLDAVNDVLDALRAGDVTGRAVLVPEAP